jgi:hypothetical protein
MSKRIARVGSVLRGSGYFCVMPWGLARRTSAGGVRLDEAYRFIWHGRCGICITYYCGVIEPGGDVGATSMVARWILGW